jgi:hypothetical protein
MSTEGAIRARKQHFLAILARYARARMEIEGLTLDQLAEIIGASGKNWVYRVLAHDQEPEISGGRVDAPLMRLIDWIGFGEGLVCGGAEPGKEDDTYWGDIHQAILHCEDIPNDLRQQLWDIVQAWARSVDYCMNRTRTTIDIMSEKYLDEQHDSRK